MTIWSHSLINLYKSMIEAATMNKKIYKILIELVRNALFVVIRVIYKIYILRFTQENIQKNSLIYTGLTRI